MAMGNVVGDACYLGYAFVSDGVVSVPKLLGAVLAIMAQGILLAYGDAPIQKVAGERGGLSAMVLYLRAISQKQLKRLPPRWIRILREKPVGIPFALLALNGVGLFVDSLYRLDWQSDEARLLQGALGLLIVLGTGAFALADFVKGQAVANSLLYAAPRILAVTTAANLFLAFATFNPFLLTGSTAFIISNFAGLYVKIDKKEPVPTDS